MKTEQRKTLFGAIIIILIIGVIGLFQVLGFTNYLTGYATTALGTATVNVSSVLSIRLTDMNITFGTGTFSTPTLYAILESNNSNTYNGTWVAVNDPFVLENDGNVIANITITASQSAANWLGGTAAYAAMYYKYNDSETGSCLMDTTFNPVVNATNGTYWMVLPVSTATNGTCQRLNFSDASDSMRVDLKIQIPADTAPGLKSNAVTFTATQSV